MTALTSAGGIALVALLGADVASGQSLAEVARREEARRRAIKEPARLYTNADLERLHQPSDRSTAVSGPDEPRKKAVIPESRPPNPSAQSPSLALALARARPPDPVISSAISPANPSPPGASASTIGSGAPVAPKVTAAGEPALDRNTLLIEQAKRQPPQAKQALLDLIVNSANAGDVIVVFEDSQIWIPAEALQRARLRGLAGTRKTINGQAHVLLSSLEPALVAELDEQRLQLELTAQPSAFGVTTINVQHPRPEDISYRRDPSAFLNYGVNLRTDSTWDASAEAGFSVRGALLTTTMTGLDSGRFTRGLSQLAFDDRRRLQRWILGDTFVNTGVLGGGALIGGITLSRNFGLDPYFIRFPTLDFSGAVVTPSTLEVYVNDRLVDRRELRPGQFELNQVPVPNGSGQTRLVLRDAFGVVREVGAPYYLTSAVLARGVHQYSYTLGYNRLQNSSWGYIEPMILGSHRVGLTDTLTTGFRLEAMRARVSGGPLLNARLWRLGEIEVGAAFSSDRGTTGRAASLGYSYGGRPVSFGASVRSLSSGYSTLGFGARDRKSRLQTDAFVGLLLGAGATLTVQHGLLDEYPVAPAIEAFRQQRISVTASSRIARNANLFVTGSRVRRGRAWSDELQVGVTMLFGTRTGLSVSYQPLGENQGTTFELQRPVPVGTGFGYRVQADDSRSGNGLGTLLYHGPFGQYQADYHVVSGTQAARLNVAGGLVLMDRSLFATRPVQESFALIKVPGIEGVHAFASNQPVGRTSRRGYLLVPNLLPYYGNILSIADQDVPLDRSLEETRRVIAPPYRGGALVTFDARRVRAVTGSVSLEANGERVVPAYGLVTVSVKEATIESPIGQEGEFYLEGVPAGRHRAWVDYRGERCEFTLEVPASTDPFIRIGTVRCLVR